MVTLVAHGNARNNYSISLFFLKLIDLFDLIDIRFEAYNQLAFENSMGNKTSAPREQMLYCPYCFQINSFDIGKAQSQRCL